LGVWFDAGINVEHAIAKKAALEKVDN